MSNIWIKRWIQTPMQRVILFGILAALLTSTVGVYTIISATDLNPGGAGDEDIALAINTYVADADVTITSPDLAVTTVDLASAGTTTAGAVEAATPAGDVRGVLVAGNYQYTFKVIESGVDTWTTPSTDQFRIRVWGHDFVGTETSTLLGTLYTTQVTADAGSVEGVNVTVDLGSATRVYDNYNIIVDRQAEM